MILQSLEELENELGQGKFRPVYLILGPEEYECRQAIALLKKNLLNPEAQAFDYSEFTAGETSVDEIIESANTFPMISRRRVVIVNQAEKLREAEQDSLADLIKTLSPRSTLILFAPDLDRRKKFYKTLREGSCVAEFPKLKGPALEQWAEAFARKQGYRISPPAIRKIVDLAGSDLQTLATELEKLLLYAGNTKDVPDSAVEDLIRVSRQQSIFDLINAVGRHDRGGALKSLANLVSMGEHPLVVVVMLARYCRQMLIAQEGLLQGSSAREIGSAAQIPPYFLNDFLRQARSTSPGSIREMFVRLADIDRSLKSSSLDGRLLLENLICGLV